METGKELFRENHRGIAIGVTGRIVVRSKPQGALRRWIGGLGWQPQQKGNSELGIPIKSAQFLGEVQAQQIARILVLVLARCRFEPIPNVQTGAQGSCKRDVP